eukprot:4479036-Prymnesium_polylepis.1
MLFPCGTCSSERALLIPVEYLISLLDHTSHRSMSHGRLLLRPTAVLRSTTHFCHHYVTFTDSSEH